MQQGGSENERNQELGSILVSYQSKLTDHVGNAIDGNVDMVFELYHQAEGETPFWTASYTGAQTVEVDDGHFNVLLGSQTASTRPTW